MNYETDQQGALLIGGIAAKDLADQYGTPLYVYDVDKMRANARAFVNTFKDYDIPAQVAYAVRRFHQLLCLK